MKYSELRVLPTQEKRSLKFNNINVLSDAYTAMRALGLVKTKAEFSQRILGMGASYLTSMEAKEREPSDEMLARTMKNLESCRQSYLGNGHLGHPHAPALNAQFERMTALRDLIDAHLAARQIFALPENLVQFRSAAQ